MHSFVYVRRLGQADRPAAGCMVNAYLPLIILMVRCDKTMRSAERGPIESVFKIERFPFEELD